VLILAAPAVKSPTIPRCWFHENSYTCLRDVLCRLL